MSQYEHVIAAIDLTEEATEVLEKARRLAIDHNAKLSVINVIKPINYAYAGLEVSSITSASSNFEQEARTFATQKLSALATELNIDPDAVHVFFGPPSLTIKDECKLLGADLLVIGTHSRSGLGRLLGSTANSVLHGSSCDVLAVRVGAQT